MRLSKAKIAEILSEIETLAELQFTKREVRISMGGQWPEGADLAYERGRLRGEAEVRAAIKRSAAQGSPPAQAQYVALAQGQMPDWVAMTEAEREARYEMAQSRTIGYSLRDYARFAAAMAEQATDPKMRLKYHQEARKALERSQDDELSDVHVELIIVQPGEVVPGDADPGDTDDS